MLFVHTQKIFSLSWKDSLDYVRLNVDFYIYDGIPMHH